MLGMAGKGKRRMKNEERKKGMLRIPRILGMPGKGERRTKIKN
jgi:hypothetical protein